MQPAVVTCVPEKPRLILVVDVRTLAEPDLRTLEVLARLQLTARRLGATITLSHPCERMRDLLVWSGLDQLLPLEADSGVDRDRRAEEREQLLVNEEIDPRDPTL